MAQSNAHKWGQIIGNLFQESLRESLLRVANRHGIPQQLPRIQAAIAYLQNYDDSQASPAPALKYEIDVRYNNGDVIHGIFQDKAEAVRFLQTFA